MTTPTRGQLNAIKIAVEVILDIAKDAGPMGAPSGVIYAAMMGHGMTLNSYQQILGAMQRTGKIVVEYDCVKLPEFATEEPA